MNAGEVKRITVNGTELAYVEAGAGEPIVFVHGGLQDYRMWGEHLPRFTNRYRVIAYSRRNNYPNETSPNGMPDGAADAHADDLASLLGALGLSTVRVAAHSSGAHAALFFAAKHRSMIVSLALNEPPALGVLNGLPNIGDLLKDWGSKMALAREPLKMGDIERGIPSFVNAVGGPGAYERRSDAEKKMNFENVASYQADATTSRPRPVFTREMAGMIVAPTLLTTGEKSPQMFHRVVDQLAVFMPNAEQIEIAQSSHSVPSDNPTAYGRAVFDFMTKH